VRYRTGGEAPRGSTASHGHDPALTAAVRNPSAEMGWPPEINYDNFDEAS